MTKKNLIAQYFKAQLELGVPNDLVLDEAFDLLNAKPTRATKVVQNISTAKIEVREQIPQPISESKLQMEADVKIPELIRNTEILQSPKIAQNSLNTEPTVADSDKRELLKELFYRCRNCKACSLCKTRKNFVFGAGTVFTDVMVIGEAPGEQEDIEAKPFVGAAGILLTKMLAAINLERDKIFIANILKCRPPQNRKPNNSEIAACIPMLKKQIKIINPSAILALGGTAANALLCNEKSVGSLRGIVHYYENIPVIVSYHPSALLRDATWKKPAWDDLQKFEQLLKELRNG